MKVLTLYLALLFTPFLQLNAEIIKIGTPPIDSSFKDVIITKDGKQLLGKLRAVPSLKFSFGIINFLSKDISLIIFHADKNKLQYITKDGHSYSAQPLNDNFVMDSVENSGKFDPSKVLTIFTSNEYTISKNNDLIYVITLKNGDQFTSYLSPESFKNSFQLSNNIPICLPNSDKEIILSTNEICSVRRMDPYFEKEISSNLEQVLKKHHIIQDEFLTKSVGISWDDIKKKDLFLNNESLNQSVDKTNLLSLNSPGLLSSPSESIDNTIAYEDFNHDELPDESNNLEDDDAVDLGYTFISSNRNDSENQIISLNNEQLMQESKKDNSDTSEKKIISIQEYTRYLNATSQKNPNIDGNNEDPVTGINVQQAKKFADWKNKILVIRGKQLKNVELGMLVETPNAIEWIADDHKKLPSKKVEKNIILEKRSKIDMNKKENK